MPKMTPPRPILERQLAELMSKIRMSKRSLDVMYDKVAVLEKRLQYSEDTYSDISALPMEILGMVFKEVSGRACTGDLPLSEGCVPGWSMTRPELSLSHVSKYWRAIAIGTPSLWTYIRLCVKQPADLVDLYLSRSRGLPLDITFRQHFVCGIHSRQAYPADYSRITATILNHIHVCRRLEIRTNISVPELLEGLGRSRAPLLEEIILYHPSSGVRESTFSSSSFPKLAHLELGELVSILTMVPTYALTSLTLMGLPLFGLPASAFLDFLSGLQSLSRLTLLDEVVDFNRLHPTDAIQMPSLRFLMLKPGPDISRAYLTGLMEMIMTPALEQLVLDFTDVASPREIQLFLRHLKRESPRFLSLRDITINSSFDGFDIASALVHAAPNIECLALSRYNVDSVLLFLTHDARREAFSKLHTLHLGSPHFDWDVLLHFLQKRKLLCRPLRHLDFQGFEGPMGTILDGLFGKLLEACLSV